MANLGTLPVGTRIADDYEVVRALGEGGMGAVYVVNQRSTGRERALKVMHARMAGDSGLRDKFIREATIGATIQSEHVVQVLAAGVDATSGSPWLVMELLRGHTLAAFVETKGALRQELAREIFAQLAHGLSAAHRASVVHRDLKPENVFLSTSLRSSEALTVKILDFGIAKLVADSMAKASAAIGSPLWMAPEQADLGAEISPATDVWAMGLLAFFLLTGKPFWRADSASPVMVMKEVIFDDIPIASERARTLGFDGELPSGFDAWFGRCVCREAKKRFSDAKTAHQGFEALYPLSQATPSDEAPTARRASRWAWLALPLLGALVPLVWWLASRRVEPTSRAFASVSSSVSIPAARASTSASSCAHRICVCDDHLAPAAFERSAKYEPHSGEAFSACGATADCVAGNVCVDDGYCKPICTSDEQCAGLPFEGMKCRSRDE
jgi:serine/threonine protein kinase